MTKVLTWARQYKYHRYQWGFQELRKANVVACYILLGLLVSLGCILGIGMAVSFGETFETIAVACFAMLYGTALGFSFALEWADKKLKKSN